jgi:hypothetical protein
MTIVVFAGPSISKVDRSRFRQIIFRPPAAQGDIFRACSSKPKAIGLIDGYFDGVPSVWHKEILWALSQGIAVFGSASMGALRAAELDSFGMKGVGTIYHWYRDGVLEDDDEVALLHGPEETHFCTLSEAMVNVRATCEAALRASVLDPSGAKRITEIAKLIHYKDRSWHSILGGSAEFAAFRQWLDRDSVDQKAIDAVAMMDELCKFDAERDPSLGEVFQFEHTNLWVSATRQWAADTERNIEDDVVSDAEILEELRLDVALFKELAEQALLRSLLLSQADETQAPPDHAEKMRAMGRLRNRLGLTRKVDLDVWVHRNNLDEEALENILHDEVRIEQVRREHGSSRDGHIIALLKLRDVHGKLSNRAKDKKAFLKSQAVGNAEVPNHGIAPPLLLNWFFANRKEQSLSEDIDNLVATLGLHSRQDFYRLLADEYVYSMSTHGGQDGSKVKFAPGKAGD